MFKAIHVSPMVPSYDVRHTIHFFEDIFGFAIFVGDENYAVLKKDDVLIHIIRAGDIGEMSFYLELDDIDEWWTYAEEKLKDLEVRPPFDREYGMREAHINIPNTKTQLFVGQPIN